MKKILIVEDTKSISEEIATILGFENFNVFEAYNGREGLSMARKELPDLILSDILMPEIDGYKFREELSKAPETANIPFIFLSAMASKEEIKRGEDLGVYDFVIKPFLPEELVNKIRRILA